MGAAKHRDVMRSMNRHGARTKQKAMMAENEVARTNDLEEMAEMRRLAREEQRREHAAQRRAQWEERRQR